MGFDKVLTPLNGRSPLEAVLAAVGERRVVAVLPSNLAGRTRRLQPDLSIRINDEPERGMTHSLRVGLGTVPWECDFGVLLADMPSVTATMLSHTEELLFQGADVAYPVGLGGRPGHPVLFSWRMRATVETLEDGDSLRTARDGARSVATWCHADQSAFLDLDTPEQWQAFKNSASYEET